MVAAGFPVKRASVRRQAYMDYFDNLSSVLPCRKCRKHYSGMIRQSKKNGSYADHFASRESLQKFVFDMHNKINARLGKKIVSPAVLEDHKTHVEKMYRAPC